MTTARVQYFDRMTSAISLPHDGSLLDALLDSWRRNNLILINLLRALPEADMGLRATDSSPTVAQLFMPHAISVAPRARSA